MREHEHKRTGDCGEEQSRFFQIAKKCLPPSVVAGIVTALVVTFIIWVSGAFVSIPISYATKGEVKTIEQKHADDMLRMDEKKMDKTTYMQNHESLRSELKEDLGDIKTQTNATQNLVLKIWESQQQQYNKVNKK